MPDATARPLMTPWALGNDLADAPWNAATHGLALFLLGLLACGGEPMPVSDALPSLSDVTLSEWRSLASRRVFFGHQSVGANVVQGISEVLAAHPEIRLNVVETKDLAGARAGGFYHARVGRNEHPDEKVQEFARIASSWSGGSGAVGMVKFCYVDVRADTDPQALFEAYQRRMAKLRVENPGLTIVHLTMPLTTNEGSLAYWKLKLRGRDTQRDRNIVRNRYNALLRGTYAGKEPVFDIAAVESRHPNGTVSGFRNGNGMVYSLAPELTTDGGHLNDAGRRLVAEQLLVFLAKLPPTPAAIGDKPAS